jgi:hypothetical protein
VIPPVDKRLSASCELSEPVAVIRLRPVLEEADLAVTTTDRSVNNVVVDIVPGLLEDPEGLSPGKCIGRRGLRELKP